MIRRDWLIWGLVVLMAVGLRWGHSFIYPADVQLHDIDARGYHQLALNLLAGNGFSLNSAPPYLADSIRTPGYPLLVAGVYALAGAQPRQVALLQGLFDGVTTALLMLAAWRLTQHKWVVGLVGGLYAFNPAAIRFSNELLTENVLALLITSIAVGLLIGVERPDARRWALLGGLSAAAVLIKPNVIGLPILVGLALGVQQRQLGRMVLMRGGLAFGLISVGLLLPWVVRNQVVFGQPMLSSAFDNNLHRVSAVATLVQVQGEVVAPWTPRWEEIYLGIVDETARRYRWAGPPQTSRELLMHEQQLAVVAREMIAANLPAYLQAHATGFVRGWVPQEHRYWYEVFSGQAWDALSPVEGALGLALQAAREQGLGAGLWLFWQARFGSLPPLASGLWVGFVASHVLSALAIGAAVWRLLPQRGVWLVWVALVVGYVTFLPGPISYVRFRLPVQGLLVLWVGVGLVQYWQLLTHKKSSPHAQ